MGLLEAARRLRPSDSPGIGISDEYRDVFVAEAREHLEDWESALLSLESGSDETESLNQVFRAVHTIKGSAGFIGFETLQRLTHYLESTLQNIRDGAQALTPERSELLFQGLDLSGRMVETFAAGQQWEENVDGFLQKLAECGGVDVETVPSPNDATESAKNREPKAEQPLATDGTDAGNGSEATGRRFMVEVRVDATGREAYLRAFLLRTRILSIATLLSEQPSPEVLGEQAGGSTYRLSIATELGEEEIKTAANVDQIVILSIVEQSESLPQQSKSGAAPTGQREPDPGGQPELAQRHDGVVRVSVERLDNLLNLVGELVVQNSSFAALSQELESGYGRTSTVAQIQEKAVGLGRITRDLQDGIMKARMLPIEYVLNRFRRVVRDLSHTIGKEVVLELFGGETEIDKKVIDRIGEPLLHLVRNAIDHGIEDPAARKAAGKVSSGLLRMGAYQDGDHICIEVTDDGKGLDREAILRRAHEKGLIDRNGPPPTDEQVLSVIFHPGFSTAERISNISGRGVGMDAVKSSIDELGGTLKIRSIPKKGTSVKITLPLTTAIIRALLVEVQGHAVAIPLSSVNEVLEVRKRDIEVAGRQRVIRVRGRVMSIVRLRELLRMPGSDTNGSADLPFPVVVVDYNGRRLGMSVDAVSETQEIVVKSLSRNYREVDGIIGATILGTGRIALIVDVEAMVRKAHQIYSVSGTHAPVVSEAIAEEEGEIVEIEALYELAAEVLTNVVSSGALRASMALTKMTGMEIRVGFPECTLVRLADVGATLGGEDTRMAGIYVGITGELDGGILMAIPEEQILPIHSYLQGTEAAPPGPADDEEIESIDMSAIAEYGNLLSAAFINAISDEAGMSLRSRPPEVSVDMALALLDAVVARHNYSGDRILLTKAVVYFGEDEEIGCNMILLLDPQSLGRLLAVFASGST